MNSIINFMVESGISLAVLSVLYLVFLRKETYFHTNRIFLLLSVVFSILLPFLRIPVYTAHYTIIEEVRVTPYQNLLEAVMVTGQGFSENMEKALISSNLVIFIYLTGMLIFLAILLIKVYRLQVIIRNGRVVRSHGYKLVVCDSDNTPFAFLSYIFINRKIQSHPDFGRMLKHEMEHIRQGHTYDLLILEILVVFQWFNPFIWILRRAIRENHEFIADRAVLDTGIRPAEYKELLLSQYIGGSFSTASHFNYSLIRNRLRMISRMKSSKAALMKIVPGILISAALILVFACEQTTAPAYPEAPHPQIRLEKVDRDTLSISGEREDLLKITEMLAEGNYTISYNPEAGKVTLIRKPKHENLSPSQSQVSQIIETPHHNSDTSNTGKETGHDNAQKSLDRHIAQNELNTQSGTDMPILSTTVQTRNDTPRDEQVFFVVEEMPEYPGGEAALRNQIASTVKYPEEAQQKGIQGRVYVTFVVSRDGTVKHAKIAREVDPLLDREALRVVAGLPAWKPGRQKGEAVNVSYTVPINFALQ
jgi:TonB family protein